MLSNEGLEVLMEALESVNPISLGLAFCFGTFIGSFLNVCIGRMPVGKSIVWPGSACTSCGVPLAWWQNVPVVSYLLLGGRCHECHTPFSWRYLFLEVLAGGLAALVLYRVGGVGYEFAYYFAFCCLLVVVFFVDLDAWIILDQVNYTGIGLGLVGAWWLPFAPGGYPMLGELGFDPASLGRGGGNVAWGLVGAALGFGLFQGIAILGSLLARQTAMGQGDVKLAAMIGAFLGPAKGMLALFVAFPLGALVAVPLIFLHRSSGKTPVPFGTFMAVGAVIALVAGDSLLSCIAGGWASAVM